MRIVAIKNKYGTIYSFRTQGKEWEHVGVVFTLGYMPNPASLEAGCDDMTVMLTLFKRIVIANETFVMCNLVIENTSVGIVLVSLPIEFRSIMLACSLSYLLNECASYPTPTGNFIDKEVLYVTDFFHPDSAMEQVVSDTNQVSLKICTKTEDFIGVQQVVPNFIVFGVGELSIVKGFVTSSQNVPTVTVRCS